MPSLSAPGRAPGIAPGSFPGSAVAARRRPLRQRLRGRYGWLVLAGLLGAAGGGGLVYSAYQPIHRATATLAVEPARTSAAVPSQRLDAIVDSLVDTLSRPTLPNEAAVIHRDRLTVARLPGLRQIIVQYDDPDAATASATVGAVLDAGVAGSDLWEHEAKVGQLDALRRLAEQERARLKEFEALQRQAHEAFGMLPLDQRIADRRRELDRLVVQLREVELTLTGVEEKEQEEDAKPQALPEAAGGRWADLVRQVVAAMPRTPRVVAVVDLDGTAVPAMTVEELKAREGGLEAMRGVVSGELADLIARAATVNTLQRKVAEAKLSLDQTQERVDLLANTDAVVARLWVLDRGERTVLAQPRVYAVVLGGGGAAGAVLLCGLTTMLLASDRRLRRSAMVQASPQDPPVLGAVPLVTHMAGGDEEQDDRLAQAVHEVRSILEVHAQNHGSRVFAITSPTRGSGKTSLTVGLGTSLAVAGSRTLIIDVDLAKRLSEATHGAVHQSLDQALRDMGYVAEPSTAVARRDAAVAGRGLAGMLDGSPLRESVVPTKVALLDVLHAHSVEPGHVGRLSGRFLADLARQAREQYDLVLIDAGPVPGSVEGMLAAAGADGVLIVVQRNESQQQYDRALSHLRLVEANVIGTVFNRADDRDVTATSCGPTAKPRRAKRPRVPASDVGTGSGILAAAVQARAGSGFDRAEPIKPSEVLPIVDLAPAPVIEDDEVVARPPTSDAWENDLEASLDKLIDEVSGPLKTEG